MLSLCTNMIAIELFALHRTWVRGGISIQRLLLLDPGQVGKLCGLTTARDLVGVAQIRPEIEYTVLIIRPMFSITRV